MREFGPHQFHPLEAFYNALNYSSCGISFCCQFFYSLLHFFCSIHIRATEKVCLNIFFHIIVRIAFNSQGFFCVSSYGDALFL